MKVNSKDSRRFFNAAQTESVLTLEVYDVIGADFFGDGITASAVSDAIAQAGSHDSVALRINSPGGDAFEGVAIYNVLKNHGKPVNVYVDGLAASAASIVAMAGDTICMGTGAMMMIHPAQGCAMVTPKRYASLQTRWIRSARPSPTFTSSAPRTAKSLSRT